jgi:hypothetical protein
MNYRGKRTLPSESYNEYFKDVELQSSTRKRVKVDHDNIKDTLPPQVGTKRDASSLSSESAPQLHKRAKTTVACAGTKRIASFDESGIQGNKRIKLKDEKISIEYHGLEMQVILKAGNDEGPSLYLIQYSVASDAPSSHSVYALILEKDLPPDLARKCLTHPIPNLETLPDIARENGSILNIAWKSDDGICRPLPEWYILSYLPLNPEILFENILGEIELPGGGRMWLRMAEIASTQERAQEVRDNLLRMAKCVEEVYNGIQVRGVFTQHHIDGMI